MRKKLFILKLKVIERWLLFLTFQGIVLLAYTQQNQKNILDSIPITDSVVIPYRHIVASTMAYKELKKEKLIDYNQQQELRWKNAEISSLKIALKKSEQKDSISQKLYINEHAKYTQSEINYLNADFNRKKEKTAKIISATSIPVAIIVSFLLGWYIHSSVIR